MKKTLTAVLALVLCLSMLIGCSGTAAKTEGGDKATAKIILIDKEDQQYTYDIEFAEGSSLRDALYEAKLIDEDEYSAMFVQSIDGHIANVLEDGCTWMPLDENGKQIMGTFDDIIVANGQTITLQYYIVPDFD